MDYTTYQTQINILNSVKGFINSPAMRNAIEVRNNIAEITRPIIEMQRQIERIYQPAQGMLSTINAIRSVAERFSGCNAEIMQIAQNVSALKNKYAHLQGIRAAMETMSQYQSLYDTLNAVPDTFYDEVLENTEYSKNDILSSVDEFVGFVDELEEDNNTDESIVEQKKKEFFAKHPKCAILLYIITMLLTIGSGISICKDVFFPMVQESIVWMEGNGDIYFTKTDAAKVYEQPNCKSKTVGKLLYGERMQKVEDINMWIKVRFTDTDGNEHTGWVAKRNLIDYRTWKFNSDSLYE